MLRKLPGSTGNRPLNRECGGAVTVRVVIADDHGVVRQGIRMALALDPEMDVVGEAADGAEAIELARLLRPDVVVMDLVMPNVGGIAAIAAIREELPDTEVVALTSVLDDAAVIGAVRAGAISYLLKDTGTEEICRAVRRAAEKQVTLSPAAAARLMRELQAPTEPQALTPREAAVLQFIAQGQGNREIARRLELSEKTVSAHVSNILVKLGMRSRTQAAVYALRAGIGKADNANLGG
jgi:DNA-binding NarL/FixJ family response regulator